ncbi:hypothetical protein WM25_01710 [Burkholderia ubonensis]|nr:hypothetical protein WM25_01710 [Burkholderia ubonensis]
MNSSAKFGRLLDFTRLTADISSTLVPTKKFSGNYDTSDQVPRANGRPEPLTNEAKVRLMNTHQSDSSYHSAVMSGRRNHRCATAFDVSIGQARALDDPDWAKLLRAIADWRIPLMKVKQSAGEGRYGQLDSATREIVEANCTYYKDGTFPAEKLVPKTPPTPVVSEILRTRTDHFIQQVRSNPLNNIPLP